MDKNKSKAIQHANAFDIPVELADIWADLNLLFDDAKKLLGMDEYEITALVYKIIYEEEKHRVENSQLYDPKKKRIAEAIYSKWNDDRTSNLKNNVDTLSFKKSCKTTSLGFSEEDECEEYKVVIAEIYINDKPLMDIVKQFDEYHYEFDYNIASSMYMEFIGEATHHSSSCKHYLKGIDAVLMVCNSCYFDCCSPLAVRTKETDKEILWYSFYSCRSMDTDRSKFPVFRFNKEQYKAALEQLKAIADEDI